MEEVSVLLELNKKKERHTKFTHGTAVVFIFIGALNSFIPYLEGMGKVDYGMLLFIVGVVILGSIQRTNKEIKNERELLTSLERRLPKM